MEEDYMFNSLDYTLGVCSRCGKELYVHNDDGMCLICQYETMFKDLCQCKDQIQYMQLRISKYEDYIRKCGGNPMEALNAKKER